MNMKKSNQFLASLGLLTFIMICYTNFNLVREYKKIDLSDPFKNYLSLPSIPHSVLKLSGSNGYPIVIQRNVLSEIIISDIHCKIADFDAEELRLTVNGNALSEIKDCHLNTMNVEVSNNGHLEFFHENSVDSLQLAMSNTSSVYLKNVNLHHIEQDLTDSVSIILSNDVFTALVN